MKGLVGGPLLVGGLGPGSSRSLKSVNPYQLNRLSTSPYTCAANCARYYYKDTILNLQNEMVSDLVF